MTENGTINEGDEMETLRISARSPCSKFEPCKCKGCGDTDGGGKKTSAADISETIRRARNEAFKPRSIDIKNNIVYGGDISVPTPDKAVGSVLFGRMLRLDRRNEILQICADTHQQMTTKEFLENSVAVAEKLLEEGTKKGDFILLVGGNTINMNITLTGILLIAAVPVPLSFRTDLDEFHAILKWIRPTYFGCEKRYLYPFKHILVQKTGFSASRMFLLDDENEPSEPEITGFLEFIKNRGQNFESFRPTEVENPKTELALAMKALTDGALGRVVGVTHHNLNSIIARYDAVDDGVINRKKVILMVQKVLWMSGIYCLIFSCAFGAKLIVMRDFQPETFLKAIDDYKVTTTYLFSSKWWLLFKEIPQDKYNLSFCNYAYCTDGSLPLTLTNGLKEKTGITMMPSYGVTELSGLVLKQTGLPKKERSVGNLVPQVYGKVISEKTSRNVGPNTPGELCFKGPIVSLGYINNKRATQFLFDKEGYLCTGQYGFYDENGEFFIIDKMSYQINYKDHKVSPKELEGIIKTLEPVKDVCVTGIMHPEEGEYPIALVVPQRGQKITESDIIKYVDGSVPDHKKLRGGVIFLSKIPRFRETGNIKREMLKKILSKYRMKTDSS